MSNKRQAGKLITLGDLSLVIEMAHLKIPGKDADPEAFGQGVGAMRVSVRKTIEEMFEVKLPVVKVERKDPQ